MKSAYLKTVFRTVKNNLGRCVAVTVIILLGIAFVSGLGALSPKIEASVGSHLVRQQAADLIIKSASASGKGLTAEQRQIVSALSQVAAAMPLTVIDGESEGISERVCVLPIADGQVNRLTLLAGRLPQNKREVLCERASDSVLARSLGEKISVMGLKAEVVGIVANPLIFLKEGEPSTGVKKNLQQIVYFDSAYSDFALPVTDLYVRAVGTDVLGVFSDEYTQTVEACKKAVESALIEGEVQCLTLRQNKSAATVKGYTDKVDVICLIFPVFFIAVASLVVLTTMTRLIEEERSAIACYKTLGYTNAKVAAKYVSLAVVCCLLGAALGTALGVTVLPAVLYPAFNTLFFMPAMTGAVTVSWGLVSSAAMLLAVTGVTGFVILKELKEKPAQLMRPKAPKAGKKIFLERMPFLWKRLPFKYKSTFRNIFRYVKNFVMTVVSVAGSTALVFAGFGLNDISRSKEMTSTVGGMAESFSVISLVVIVFAALLCILVLYNLTNMNIGERKREIATLKVLGYHEKEVALYIFREVFIMALIGIAVGLPLGFGLLHFVFSFMNFGKIEYVRLTSYFLTAGMAVVFILICDLLLHRKIKAVDMTASLKTVE